MVDTTQTTVISLHLSSSVAAYPLTSPCSLKTYDILLHVCIYTIYTPENVSYFSPFFDHSIRSHLRPHSRHLRHVSLHTNYPSHLQRCKIKWSARLLRWRFSAIVVVSCFGVPSSCIILCVFIKVGGSTKSRRTECGRRPLIFIYTYQFYGPLKFARCSKKQLFHVVVTFQHMNNSSRA